MQPAIIITNPQATKNASSQGLPGCPALDRDLAVQAKSTTIEMPSRIVATPLNFSRGTNSQRHMAPVRAAAVHAKICPIFIDSAVTISSRSRCLQRRRARWFTVAAAGSASVESVLQQHHAACDHHCEATRHEKASSPRLPGFRAFTRALALWTKSAMTPMPSPIDKTPPKMPRGTHSQRIIAAVRAAIDHTQIRPGFIDSIFTTSSRNRCHGCGAPERDRPDRSARYNAVVRHSLTSNPW